MGNSFDRKIRRKKFREKAKQNSKDLQEKIGLFDSLPENCLVCQKPFDKKNKEMVQSWSVVVGTDKVNLYCPTCWKRANTVADAIKETADEQE